MKKIISFGALSALFLFQIGSVSAASAVNIEVKGSAVSLPGIQANLDSWIIGTGKFLKSKGNRILSHVEYDDLNAKKVESVKLFAKYVQSVRKDYAKLRTKNERKKQEADLYEKSIGYCQIMGGLEQKLYAAYLDDKNSISPV